jgi:hypothetical protein
MGRTRKLALTITTAPKQPPPEEFEFRDNAVEETTVVQENLVVPEPQLYEQDMKFVFTAIADWIDSVTDEIVFEYADQDTGEPEFADADIWENVSVASLEEVDDAVDGSPIAIELHVATVDQASALVNLESSAQIAIDIPDTPCAADESRPPSRSSTPSRSVRNRRRIIGGVVRPATPSKSAADSWSSAIVCQRQAELGALQQCRTMKRALSTSAMALDLGSAPLPAGTPQWSGRPATPGKITMALEPFSMGKSQSLGSLHVISSKSGLGLSPMKIGGKGVLPVLGDDKKAGLIAWSVNIGRTKKTALRSVY